ncbi:MAG: SET domain-containing protein [Ferruginibacter sp.]|jgi:SET domain-containing protein|nr:SET domain-containing protein [Ferruginibacter sp.]
MNKAELLNELMNNTFVMLKPSPVQGIGVFAIADISKGQRNIFSNDKSEWIPVSKAEVAVLPEHSRAVVENYCLYDEDNYFIPEYGFKMADLVIFLNHADNPNIISINDGENFEAIRDISAGEELFIDYGQIVED